MLMCVCMTFLFEEAERSILVPASTTYSDLQATGIQQRISVISQYESTIRLIPGI